MKKSCAKWFQKLLVLLMVFAVSSFGLHAQSSNSSGNTEKEFKNTIRFNITNPMIFGNKSIIFGYERILPNNRSFSINIGQTGFPSLDIVDSEEL